MAVDASSPSMGSSSRSTSVPFPNQMRPVRVECRLSAILAGYSRRMHNDEAVTYAKLTTLVAEGSIMRLFKVAALALIVGAPGLMSVSSARAASDCSISGTLADWGENSTGYIDLASGGSCLFPLRMRGTVSSSDISQKPAHGKLKKLNASTFEYRAKARYKGSDTFTIKATGQGPQGPAASGTSVITVHATIK